MIGNELHAGRRSAGRLNGSGILRPSGHGQQARQPHRQTTVDQVLHLDIFVDVGPMQHLPRGVDLEMAALRWRGLREPREAGEGNHEPTTVTQEDGKLRLADQQPGGLRGLKPRPRSAHATSA